MIHLSYGKVNRNARRAAETQDKIYFKEINMQDKDFVTYEYKTVSAKAKDQTRAMDLYESFGWEITGISAGTMGGVTISLRRDRKQKHRQELNKLERQAEETVDALDGLQTSETAGATLFAYLLGVAGTLILGGGMCLTMLIENSIPALVGGIVLGIVGLALCGVNAIVYFKLVTKKTKQVLPVIDQTEEKLANILEKGNDLLRTEII